MIYLDNHATTPLDPRVLAAMRPYLERRFGNASSRSHKFGWDADAAVEKARGQVAALLGAEPREIIFTSGATESNNLALKGAVEAAGPGPHHLIVSPLEHPSVLDTVGYLERHGCTVTHLETDRVGGVDPAAVAAAITDATLLVSVMAANNEIGTVQPVREIGAACEERGVFFHTDATQGVGKVAFDVGDDHVHLAALTGHKIYGPKGCGALYVRRRDPAVKLAPQSHGGGQERGLRAGTLNVAGIVGLGEACAICAAEREAEAAHCSALRERLWERLAAGFDGLERNGSWESRHPGNLHVCFPGVEAHALMMAVPDIAVSSGSACASGSLEASPTLRAIKMRPDRVASAIRFGIGRFNTEAEIDETAAKFAAAAQKLRK